MAWYDKFKTKRLSENDFTKAAKKQPNYRVLAQQIGAVFADNTVHALFEQFSTGQPDHKIQRERGSKGESDFNAGIDQLLGIEVTNAQTCRQHITALQQQAIAGTLRAGLADNPMPLKDYGATAADSEELKASKWIVNASGTLRGDALRPDAPVNLDKVRTAIEHVVQQMDATTQAALSYLHTHVVDQTTLRATRSVAPTAKYCSTGGGAYCLDQTFQLAAGIAHPAARDANWQDIACFLVGGVIRSHGFTDGNGRAARALYACALVQGGIGFIPIQPAKEGLLHGL